MNFQPFGVFVQALRNTSLRLRGWPLISASIAARPVTSAVSPARRTLRSAGCALVLRLSRAQGGKPRRLGVGEPRGMGIQKLVVEHRLERGEIAAAHRCVALVLEGEDFLVAAHHQTSLATSGVRVTKHYGMSGRHHSGLMLAARITLPHFSTSSAMSLPKSAGEPGRTVAPSSAIRDFMLGSLRAAFISLLGFSTMSVRGLLGARTPNSEAAA